MLGHFVATRQATAVAPATVCQRERPLGMFIANYGHLAINCHRSPPVLLRQLLNGGVEHHGPDLPHPAIHGVLPLDKIIPTNEPQLGGNAISDEAADEGDDLLTGS